MTIQSLALRTEAQENGKIEFVRYIKQYLRLIKRQKTKYTPVQYIECLQQRYAAIQGMTEHYLLSKAGKMAAWKILNESDECVAQLAELVLEDAQSFEDFEREFVGMAIREVVKERVN
jgi:hypothetical protein